MPVAKGFTTQSAADTFTQTLIDTNLTADGKVGWSIDRFIAYWSNGETLAAIDTEVNVILSTRITTISTFDETVEMARINYAVSNTAGVAVAYPMELIKEAIILGDRVTVQPNLYVGVGSTGGQANTVYWELEYSLVKLSDVEVLRLLVGGS